MKLEPQDRVTEWEMEVSTSLWEAVDLHMTIEVRSVTKVMMKAMKESLATDTNINLGRSKDLNSNLSSRWMTERLRIWANSERYELLS
jgi:uncharacterized protein YqfB (UPF0267 family)